MEPGEPSAQPPPPAMTAERWQRLKAAFHAAIEQPPTLREGVLAVACSGDEDLLPRLRGMLDAYDAGAGPLEGGGPEAVRQLREELQSAIEGARIGPYRVVSELGRGGMGAVYLATRIDGAFDQQVAIKLIKRGMDTEEIVGRFFHERRILATLTHPNIARLLDGGSTPDGRPYFVMEHVAGRPLTRYAEEEGLGIEARLRLFLEVCGAVQFAHRHLVVHRDLKPANVLVGDDGVPKLLDFGIAKLLGPTTLPAFAPTRHGAPPMTPDYASPEQLAGLPVTTATDVHGLGLLLFELLTAGGRRAPGGPEGGPGARLAGLPSQAARRRGDARLARRLAGDLDTIVAKALEPEPQRRYGTAAELADDLERHLAQIPVEARRPTFAYRCGRFVVRHKVATAAALVVLGLTAVSTFQAFELSRQRDRAEGARQQAEDVASFLKGIFRVADPGASLGERVSARQLVDAAAAWLLDERSAAPDWLAGSLGRLSLRPATRADLLQTIGETYENLGVPQEGERVFRRALALYAAAGAGEAALGRSKTLVHLGHLARERGDFGDGERLYAEALGLRRVRLGPSAPETGEPLNGLGLIAYERGDLPRAEGLLRQAVAVQRAGGAGNGELLAQSLVDLANLLGETDRLAEATALLEETRGLHGRLFGPGHPSEADDLSAFGGLYYRHGDLVRAEDYLRRAVRLRRKVLGDDHPKVAVAWSNLAVVQLKHGEGEAALASAHAALAILRRLPVLAHPDVADALINLADAARPRETREGALALYREALRAAGAAYGMEHATTAKLLCNFGLALRDYGELAEAERLIRQSLAIRSGRLGPESSETAISWNALATVLQRAGRLPDAEAAFRRALALRRKALPPGHLDLSSSQVGLGEVLVALGRPGEAAPLLESALAIRRAGLPAGHPRIGFAAAGLGAAYRALGRTAEARPLLAEAERILAESRH
jgi:serine/threonine-protein kinase